MKHLKKVIQFKDNVFYGWVIKTDEELVEFIKGYIQPMHFKRMIDYAADPDSDPQFGSIYRLFELSGIELARKLTEELFRASLKFINEGETLVFNDSGGYFFWHNDFRILDWKFLHEAKDVVILENDHTLPKDVKKYLEKSNIFDYLFLCLATHSLEEVLYYCKKASVIIFQSQFLNQAQVHSLLQLATQLDKQELIAVNSRDAENYLSKLYLNWKSEWV